MRAGQDPASGGQLAVHLLAGWTFEPSAVIAGFWPLPGEIDIRLLLHALVERGHPVVLPITPPLGHPLAFGRWRPGDALMAARFGTLRPIGEAMVPDTLLVPLLAFDDAGRRLGYGGGYYDRTLAALPGRDAIGCAFAAQQVDCVPAEPHDIRLSLIATERGLFFPRD